MKVAEDRAKAIETKAASVTSQAVEDYRTSKDFKEEVGGAIYDAYLKGFTEYRLKVSRAFSNLDLKDIIVEGKEQEDDKEGEDEEPKVATMKVKVAKSKGTKEVETMEGVKC